ncbi:hypothetical protein AB0J43_39635, partial [Nonomuraea fuscirosea]
LFVVRDAERVLASRLSSADIRHQEAVTWHSIPAVGLVATEPARYGWWSSHPRITERVDRLT